MEISERRQESGRQVGKSASALRMRAIAMVGAGTTRATMPASGRRDPRVPPDGLTAETSARRRWLRTRHHRICSSTTSGIQGGQPFSSTVRFLRRDRGPGASEDRCRRRFCVARWLWRGDRCGGQSLPRRKVRMKVSSTFTSRRSRKSGRRWRQNKGSPVRARATIT